MEPPHFGLSRYALRCWRFLYPDSARKILVKNNAALCPSQLRLLQMIHNALPDSAYKDLSLEQQSLVDAGIYISANQLEQAAGICKEILRNRPTDRDWILSLIAEVEAFLQSSGKQLENI